jgi:OmpA-OmpF porin, OOP family
MRAKLLTALAAPLLVAAALPASAQQAPTGPLLLAQAAPPSEQDLVNGLSRGIRAHTDNPTPATTSGPSANTHKVVASAAAPDENPSVSLHVEFATGSADLTPSARATLDRLGRAMNNQQLAGDKFRIEGHTDTVGSPDDNKSLSQRRADAVVQYLSTHYNVPSARLDAVGMGEDGLAVATPPQTSNAQNRRVKVVNLGA